MAAINSNLINQKRNLEQQLSSQFLESEIGAIHSIYFDLNILQEIYVGAMLLHAKNEEEYNKYLECLPRYQSRIDNEVCKYFDTDITDEQLLEFIRYPNNGEKLFKASPHTSVWFILKDLINLIVEKNKIIDGSSGFHCDFYINMYPAVYPPVVCKYIAAILKQISANITFKTVCLPFVDLPQQIRLTQDMLFLNDVSVLMDTDSPICKEVYEMNAYDSKYIFARRTISNKQIKDEPLNDLFRRSRHFINIFTNFSFIDTIIPGVDYIQQIDDSDLKTTVISGDDPE